MPAWRLARPCSMAQRFTTAGLSKHHRREIYAAHEATRPDQVQDAIHVGAGTEADLEHALTRSRVEHADHLSAAGSVLPGHQVTDQRTEHASRLTELRVEPIE